MTNHNNRFGRCLINFQCLNIIIWHTILLYAIVTVKILALCTYVCKKTFTYFMRMTGKVFMALGSML
jgi:hypothetical protein